LAHDASHRVIKRSIAQALANLDDSAPQIVGYSFLSGSTDRHHARGTPDWMIILEYSACAARPEAAAHPGIDQIRRSVVRALDQAGYDIDPNSVILIPKP